MGRIEKIKRELIEESNKRLLGEALGEEPVRTIKYKDDDIFEDDIRYSHL